jgi:hypothetical protein
MSTPDPFAQPAPATYQFPPGTPEQVPADFGESAVQRELEQLRAQAAAGLSPEEVAEFRQLREEKKAADAKAAAEAEAAAASRQPDRHHVHLADGSVVDGSTIETHVDYGNGPVHVIGAFPKAEYVTFAPVGG